MREQLVVKGGGGVRAVRDLYLQVGAYLDVVPPELQQGGETSLDLAEELVEEGQLCDSVLIEQGAQTWQGENQKH